MRCHRWLAPVLPQSAAGPFRGTSRCAGPSHRPRREPPAAPPVTPKPSARSGIRGSFARLLVRLRRKCLRTELDPRAIARLLQPCVGGLVHALPDQTLQRLRMIIVERKLSAWLRLLQLRLEALVEIFLNVLLADLNPRTEP